MCNMYNVHLRALGGPSDLLSLRGVLAGGCAARRSDDFGLAESCLHSADDPSVPVLILNYVAPLKEYRGIDPHTCWGGRRGEWEGEGV